MRSIKTPRAATVLLMIAALLLVCAGIAALYVPPRTHQPVLWFVLTATGVVSLIGGFVTLYRTRRASKDLPV